jgi:uncharacterized protein (TIGR02679 family)
MMTPEDYRKLREQAVIYFRTQSQGYDRLFRELKRKYRSLGYLGGKVTLRGITTAEADALTGLLNRRYDPNTDEIIRVTEIERGLGRTKFSGVDLLSILEGYFGESVVSKKEEQLQQKQTWNAFLDEVLIEIGEKSHPQTHEWFEALSRHRGAGALAVRQWWNSSPQDLKQWLLTVAQALYHLSSMEETKYIRLAMLATHMTGNPHAFDMNTPSGRLLLYALCYMSGKNVPTNMEEMAQILYDHRILRDDLSSQVVVSGIFGKNANRDGKKTAEWCWDVGSEREVICLPLRTVVKYPEFEPFLEVGCLKRVWILENPAVFSSLLDRWEQDYGGYPLPPLVCSYGQFSSAVLALCDRLVSAGCQLLYSGDFDPEGFHMATRLWRRYGAEYVTLWRYTPEDYASVTQDIHIEEWRWKTLGKLLYEKESQLLPPDFIQTMQIALRNQKPVYQESLLDKLYNDVIDFLGIDSNISLLVQP